MSAVLGFDFGTGSIGVAIGQPLTGTASPLDALKAKEGQPDWNQLKRIIEEWQPDFCVVGLPLNMDGTEQLVTQQAKKFANRLHGRFGLEVKMQDERLTTTSVREELFDRGGFSSLKKGRVDSAAACMILEDYFSSQSSSSQNTPDA